VGSTLPAGPGAACNRKSQAIVAHREKQSDTIGEGLPRAICQGFIAGAIETPRAL
jgi:hypothetical protein